MFISEKISNAFRQIELIKAGFSDEARKKLEVWTEQDNISILFEMIELHIIDTERRLAKIEAFISNNTRIG